MKHNFGKLPSGILLFSAFWLEPVSAMAAEKGGDEFGAYFRVFWGLLVVLGIMFVLYGLFKKRFSLIQPRADKAIRIVEIQPLMARKALYLIEVKGTQYLIGVGNDSVNLIANVDSSPSGSFQNELDHSTNRFKP